MPLRLTIDVFSGRPNPTVVVSGLEERELLDRLAPVERARARGMASPPALPPATLGYRGIIVEQIEAPAGVARRRSARTMRTGTRGPVRIAGGFAHGPRGATPIRDSLAEEFICGSNGPFRVSGLPPAFFDVCPREVQRFRDLLLRWPWKKWPWPLRPTCACAPLWEPGWWNDNGQVQWNNNCYNYGTNYRTDTFAQPGRANGAMYNVITCAEVKAGAIADALLNAPNANKCPKEGHLVALVVGPHWDFHWYRKGRNGYWTHKPGGTQATNLDNSGNLIADPRTADRGNYTDFCSFMIVMHGHTKIN
jgi:hypothetical protein